MAIIGQAIFDLLKYGKLISRNSFQKPRDGQMSHYYLTMDGGEATKIKLCWIFFYIVLKYEKELILIEKNYYLLKPAN
jgi:hypothetical protein